MGKYKKQVKAEVAAAQKEVDTNLDVDLTTLAKSQSTRKEIRKEAKRRKNAEGSLKRTESPLAKYKCGYNSKK